MFLRLSRVSVCTETRPLFGSSSYRSDTWDGDVLIPCGRYQHVPSSGRVWQLAAVGSAVLLFTTLIPLSNYCAAVGNLWVQNRQLLTGTVCSARWAPSTNLSEMFRRTIRPSRPNMGAVYPSRTLAAIFHTIIS
jgi:hypothetical protein